MTGPITPIIAGNDILLNAAVNNKDSRYRLSKFVRWLNERQLSWYQPTLAAYRDDLLARGLAPATVSAHLSTIRARYQTLLRVRDLFFNLAPRTFPDGTPLGPADRKAMVDEIITRLQHAVAPQTAPVQTVIRQDRPDQDHLRLTRPQANALLAAPGVESLAGLRDTVVIALMLSTGIREAELSALTVADLRQRLGGELALHVRRGKGCKERLIPYGALEWVLAVADSWLARAGIEAGPVVRGFYKGNQRLRPGRLSVRAIQYILADYPVMIDGQLRAVKPHDLRRTYARRLYQAGVRVEAIRQNLGHTDLKTTLGYIGALDVDARRPPQIYDFDLSRLISAVGENGEAG